MALTATATLSSRSEIIKTLGMKNLHMVFITPHKPNITYIVEKFVSIETNVMPVLKTIAEK